MSISSADRDPVDRLAEEFAERCRNGEHPAVTDYVEKYPEFADQIRDLFPALMLMEQLKPVPGEQTGPYAAAGSRCPEHLGDYRILREVGRGGMGVVYEAEQVSLGRRVALKLLPPHALNDVDRQERFRREARAAARLHHTNIVPVFGVGESDGLHYYAMQFIQGQSLNDVLAELRRLRAPATTAAVDPEATGERAPQSAIMARSLLEGRLGLLAAGTLPAAPPESVPVRESSTVNSIAAGERSTLTERGTPYWRSVARLGAQAAEALAYAHAQGILHRDVKPSNLLLDTQGTVWVTDFGLAKAIADGEDLTRTGDVVGTLRYMAPERFRGQADSRSDTYSLGLTLYELLTLQAAFAASDRTQLMHQVMHVDPPRPRSLDRTIPRDLETIVLKAADKDPARRYQSAAEMAEDLRRFAEDRPIQARRMGPGERLRRWCRRNPVVSGLIAAVMLVTVVGFAGVLTQWQAAVESSVWAKHNEALAKEQRDVIGRGFPTAFNDMGLVLLDKGDLDGAAVCFRRALQFEPTNAQANQNLAAILSAQGNLDMTVPEYAEDKLRHREDHAAIWDRLCWALRLHGNLDQAVEFGRKARDSKPQEANYHNSLAYALWDQGKLDQAIAEFRDAVLLDSHFDPASANLAEAERMSALREKLPALQRGEITLRTTDDLRTMAHWCRIKGLFLTSARVYADAFTADPKLADDLKSGLRYDAACSAALAAAGKGTDAQSLPDKVTMMLRRQALAWLRADLTRYEERVDRNDRTMQISERQQLWHWQLDSDLASVRDKKALDKLPDDERDEWREFWDRVAALLKKV